MTTLWTSYRACSDVVTGVFKTCRNSSPPTSTTHARQHSWQSTSLLLDRLFSMRRVALFFLSLPLLQERHLRTNTHSHHAGCSAIPRTTFISFNIPASSIRECGIFAAYTDSNKTRAVLIRAGFRQNQPKYRLVNFQMRYPSPKTIV